LGSLPTDEAENGTGIGCGLASRVSDMGIPSTSPRGGVKMPARGELEVHKRHRPLEGHSKDYKNKTSEGSNQRKKLTKWGVLSQVRFGDKKKSFIMKVTGINTQEKAFTEPEKCP